MRVWPILFALMVPGAAFAETVYFVECYSRSGSHPTSRWTSYDYATRKEAEQKAAEHERDNPGHKTRIRMADKCNNSGW